MDDLDAELHLDWTGNVFRWADVPGSSLGEIVQQFEFTGVAEDDLVKVKVKVKEREKEKTGKTHCAAPRKLVHCAAPR